MHTLALTGPSGSGKSAVLQLFRKQGIPTIDCDSIVHALYRKKPVQQALKKQFGTSSRKVLALVIFSSPAKRKRLERILHPLVHKELQKQLKALRKKRKPLVVIDVPLLFEVQWEKRFSSTALVYATKRQCLQRLQKKGLSKKEALLRLKAQIPARKKIKKAGVVINNTGSLQKTRAQVRQLIEELKGEMI